MEQILDNSELISDQSIDAVEIGQARNQSHLIDKSIETPFTARQIDSLSDLSVHFEDASFNADEQWIHLSQIKLADKKPSALERKSRQGAIDIQGQILLPSFTDLENSQQSIGDRTGDPEMVKTAPPSRSNNIRAEESKVVL